ncbi:MAG: acetate--CoA ligase family protein, partial [Deltaproteobacteria bacterium]|nr:acetate--CoA ligase family protein [Deltaproteobacteria bacterium]
MSDDRAPVRRLLNQVNAEGRSTLDPDESRVLCEAYGIPVAREGIAHSPAELSRLVREIGFPLVMKIVSADILHKTEAGGVIVGVKSSAEALQAYEKILSNARAYKPDAKIDGVLVQQMLTGGQEVIVGALTDPSFGKVVAFGLGGILVEIFKDVTFRLAPVSEQEALAMLDGISAAEILHGVRGAAAVEPQALARIIVAVSHIVTDFPEIRELDLNPVFAHRAGAAAADVRVLVDFTSPKERYRPSQEEILQA